MSGIDYSVIRETLSKRPFRLEEQSLRCAIAPAVIESASFWLRARRPHAYLEMRSY
ncbi:hypothetical protein CBM2634_U60020 [Cupriavidus taiwanensis]|uniref:Uncharacterized protein n=1 Tax=Cupriavidus taiwanensis TaxID=164546 RepID=A0A375JDV0_9BURK|nr:hypothetical protein CBM2634_U60020 [Cupriavidus taiwanensis]